MDGYMILLNLSDSEADEGKTEWNDKVVHVNPTVDTAIALVNIQVYFYIYFAFLFEYFASSCMFLCMNSVGSINS